MQSTLKFREFLSAESGPVITWVTAVGSKEQELILTAGKRPKLCEEAVFPLNEGGFCAL